MKQSIQLAVTTHNTDDTLSITAVYQKDNELLAIAELNKAKSSAGTHQLSAAFSVEVSGGKELPVHFYMDAQQQTKINNPPAALQFVSADALQQLKSNTPVAFASASDSQKQGNSFKVRLLSGEYNHTLFRTGAVAVALGVGATAAALLARSLRR